ncbi:MAG: hypothetical protein ACR2N3_00955 [Pyrinomonadaceae bacterium]
MGLLEFIIRVAETLTESHNWQVEQTGSAKTFKGSFLVFDQRGIIRYRVQGQIVEWTGLPAEVYLYNPPEFVKRHRHSSCLQLLRPRDSWFKLHFDKPAVDFASAYTYVEHFLTEAYNLSN